MPNQSSDDINAIFGGTFDPPHNGHLLPLQQAADILQLTHISLMPAKVPALKKGVSEGHHRIAMTRLLCEIDSRFSVNLSEFERDGISYTVDTLKHIKNKRPKQTIIFIIGLDSLRSLQKWHKWKTLFDYCHLVVMLRPALNDSSTQSSGEFADKSIVRKLHPHEVASKLYDFHTSEAEFIKIVGSGIDEELRSLLVSKLAQAESTHRGINHAAFKDIIDKSAKGKLWFIKNSCLSVSSSNIRRQIENGETPNDLMPASIVNYIQTHQLYKTK